MIHWYKAERTDDPALERDIADPRQTAELAQIVFLVVAVPIFDDVDAHRDLTALLKARLEPVSLAGADIDKEIELGVRAVAKNGHVSLSEL